MDGLKPGRIVYYRDTAGNVHPSMVTKVLDQDKGVINCSAVVDGWSRLGPHIEVIHDQSATMDHSWSWMYDGQATRGEAK